MGIPIPGKDGLYIETGPWSLCTEKYWVQFGDFTWWNPISLEEVMCSCFLNSGAFIVTLWTQLLARQMLLYITCAMHWSFPGPTRTPAFWGYPPPPRDYPYYWPVHFESQVHTIDQFISDPKSKEGESRKNWKNLRKNLNFIILL